MEPFSTVSGIAAPLPAANVDTDQIVPKQFLKTIERTGLARALFHDHRFDESGRPTPDFILNRAPYDRAVILIAGDNFGCGSSREHAPWALLDFGIRCVIAPSFADIFRNNCINNGLLTITLPADDIQALMDEAVATPGPFTVDLEAQTLRLPTGRTTDFIVDPVVRRNLLAGLDAIGTSMARADDITTIEARLAATMPWLPTEQGACR